MISNHFPSTFGNKHCLKVGVSPYIFRISRIKTLAELKRERANEHLGNAGFCAPFISSGLYYFPQKSGMKNDRVVTMSEVYPIFQTRCASCHAVKPTNTTYTAPPNGVYETPEDIVKLKDKNSAACRHYENNASE